MKVAIVHYWLVSMRGGEKMLESLLELFPDADIYTHVYDRQNVSSCINAHKVSTSCINKLPFAKKLYQKYLPLMPSALLDFDLSAYDLVISSEAGPAKGVVPAPDARHICYCHAPMRYIWDQYFEYQKNAGFATRFFLRLFTPRLRVWDVTSAQLVDTFLTNSSFSAQRIKRYYGRDAEVVFGPANIEAYLGVPRNIEDFYLYFGQLADNKRVDIAIEACIALGRKLIVAGGGAVQHYQKKYKHHGNIQFLGRIDDDRIKKLYSGARALLFPGVEDMGLVPIEANAAGCPVIAYRKGGVLDTIKENVTGIFFDTQDAPTLARAIQQFEGMENRFADRPVFCEHVRQFSGDMFKQRIKKVLGM
ncbi:MAG: glycosyltransferase [Spirochaetaceae bacterium]|jgi:glycosyltransferase involved in cell wall biosynthesis|nr:glycosyltransferase [Spirochaetaceae bacterium]